MLEKKNRMTSERAAIGGAKYWSVCRKDSLIQRLGEYEDTGISPSEFVRCYQGVHCHALVSGDGSFYCESLGMEFYAPEHNLKRFYCADGRKA